MALQRSGTTPTLSAPPVEAITAGEYGVLKEESFRRIIGIERKRTERSGQPFLLMLLEVGDSQGSEKNLKALDCVVPALRVSSRETDVIGWYKERIALGVIFTDLVAHEKNSILSTMLGKVSATLQSTLTLEQFNQVSVSFHFFPDDWDLDPSGRPSNQTLYPDLPSRDNGRRLLLVGKRAIDIVVGSLALIACMPLVVILVLMIKVSSEGPVLFRQERVGQDGKRFTLLKFRSMYINNDPTTHQDYVTKLIAGCAERKASPETGEVVYKLTDDHRVTRVGHFLRRTSFDELPQLLNVLKGDMSLVGPRPALPYEVAAYQTWHRRRILDVKPGITGLWQVNGRSRVKFDDMVRLDLRYSRSWSPMLDIKILLLTPRAVLMGSGAY